MLDYKLKEDEVVLYKGFVVLIENGQTKELILTNQNIVFISKYKKLNADTEISIDLYRIDEVKMYKEEPQINIKGKTVELYLKTTEKMFEFASKTELHKFEHKIKEVLTGKTTAERGAQKVKNSIKLVDDTLGIDSVKVVGNAIKGGIVDKVCGSIKSVGGLIKKNKK